MRPLIITFVAIVCATPIFSQSSLQDSLVLHLPFDGNTLDMSGNGNHATSSGAIFTSDRLGNPNAAIQLDGIDDYLTVLNNQKLKPQLPVTIAAWVQYDNSGKNMIFRNDWEEDYYNGVWLAINGDQISGTFADGGAVSPLSRRTKRTSEPLTQNTWYHIATVIRGVGDADIYVNGRNYCGSYNGSGGGLAYSSNDGRIGTSDPFSTPGILYFFGGKIDDLRLYSRELSVIEIEQLADVEVLSVVIDSVCTGSSISISAPGGFQNYTWLPNPDLSCTSCQTTVASPADTITYKAVLEKFANCVDTFTVNVNVVECCKANFTSAIENVQQPICPSDSFGGFIVSGINGNAPYQYSINGAPFVNSGVFNSLKPASYTVTVRDSADCEFDIVIVINAPPPAILSQISTTGETAFSANDGTAKIVPSGGNGGPWSFIWSNGAATDSVNGLAPGMYTVTVTDIKGCSRTDTVEIAGLRMSISTFPEGYSWEVSPNPGHGVISVFWELPSNSTPELSLTDLRGKTLVRESFHQSSSSTSWNLELPDGIYLLSISTESYRETKRIIIQK